MSEIREWFAGKKTYFIAAAAVAVSLAAFAGEEIDLTTTIQQVVAAVLAMTIRAGIKTAGG